MNMNVYMSLWLCVSLCSACSQPPFLVFVLLQVIIIINSSFSITEISNLPIYVFAHKWNALITRYFVFFERTCFVLFSLLEQVYCIENRLWFPPSSSSTNSTQTNYTSSLCLVHAFLTHYLEDFRLATHIPY